MAPGPRASLAMVAYRHQALLFGGVSDNEAKGGEDLSSEFHNDLYWFNFNNHRWFAAQLRPPKSSSTTAAASASQGTREGTDTAAPGAASSTGGGTGSSGGGGDGGPGTQNGAPAGGGGASGISTELRALMEAGQDKSHPFYQVRRRYPAAALLPLSRVQHPAGK